MSSANSSLTNLTSLSNLEEQLIESNRKTENENRLYKIGKNVFIGLAILSVIGLITIIIYNKV